MAVLVERSTERLAQQAHAEAARLGRHPHSIFQTARGTWAFWY